MHEPLAEVLLEKLCSAVQKVQEEFASGQGIIKDGDGVNQLCQSVDDIFCHGLKEGILSWASGTETTYWPLVVKITYKEVIQDITSRTSLRNDRERCQVWVRVAAQENSLGSYLNIVTQDDKLLREFYHPHAFVFDEVKVDTAKTALLYGLSHLDFNISLDIPHQTPMKNVHRQEYSTASAAAVIPDKSSTANGYHFSYSSSITSRESLSQSPHNSLTKPKKKKKKIKSSVAEIADSLDESEGGRLTSVEKYMSSSVNDTKKEEVQNDSLHDVDTHMESLSSIRLARTVSGEFEATNNEGAFESRNIKSSSSLEAINDDIESKDTGSLQKTFDNLCLGPNSAVLTDTDADVQQNGVKIRELDKTLDEKDTTGKDSYSKQEELNENITDLENKDSVVTNDTSGANLNDFSGKTTGLSENTTTKTATEAFVNSIRRTQNEEERLCEQNVENISTPSDQSEAYEEQMSEISVKGKNNFETRLEEIKDEEDYKVSCARYEFGTPTETSFDDETKQDKNHLSPEEDEDLNFVPGIHKDDDWRSRSSSINSSGSFSQPKPVSEKVQRSSTLDSTKSSSVSGSVQNDLWRLVDDAASKRRKDSRADDMSVATEDSFSDLGIFEELLGMEEDHFSTPDNFMGFSTSEELEHAIRSCKDMIRTAAPNSMERKQLVERLIQLRVKLQENRDESTFVKVPDAKKILGHQFVKEQSARTTDSRLCDRCGKWIWTMWQSLFICKDCSFCSHRKCLELIRRPCASRKVSVSTYNLNIAPECGLNAQQYKCVECRKRISLNKGEHSEARLCDYSGQFFCEDCHWNDQVIIPARVIHNWDFSLCKVSRQTKQFLDLMIKKPLLDLEQLNPALFKFVGELREIKRLREEILIMKKYFMSCRMALESKLLLHLQDHQHFVDNSNVYSLQDILEVENGAMLPFVTRVHSLFLTHIKSDCGLCQAKGFVCEICKANEIIFAFDPHAVQCVKCRTVFHKLCFKKDSCPKCQRIRKRTSK